jgi:hypothetical protein
MTASLHVRQFGKAPQLIRDVAMKAASGQNPSKQAVQDVSTVKLNADHIQKTYRVVSCFKLPMVGVSTPPRSLLNERSLHRQHNCSYHGSAMQSRASRAEMVEKRFRLALAVALCCDVQ